MVKFSVVIPLYNKRNYIKDTIQSVLNQTFSDYEIIVVDDGSKDDSLKMAQTVKSNKLKLIHQNNQGVAVARNTGIENASGKYIAFLDADDYWHPNYLSVINALTEKFPEPDIYVTAYRIVMAKNKYHYSAHLSDSDQILDSYWLTYKHAYDIVWTSATVIKKDAIIKAGKFTPGEKIGQDLDLWSRVACNNPKVAYSPEICVDYKRDAEQNARTRVKIAYPKAFLSVLYREMHNDKWSPEERHWMLVKYNKKMIVYVFTSILAGKRKDARIELDSWGKEYPNKYVLPLRISSYLPTFINEFAYSIRMKVF